MPKKPTNSSSRGMHVNVRTAKGRKIGSTKWLQRQLNDPYIARAKKEGYRSRAAYKLIELDDQFHFLKPGATVIDLGAAPGGWTQVALQRCKGGRVLGLDLLEVKPIEGAEVFVMDFMAEDAPERLRAKLGGKPVDIVLSDMAPNSSGNTRVDHIRIMALAEAAAMFACEMLAEGGTFVCKMLQGGTERELLTMLKQRFSQVRHAKPPASRKDSADLSGGDGI